MRKRIVVVLATVLMLLSMIAGPAVAASASANCYTGGDFFSKGKGYYWQVHQHLGDVAKTWGYDNPAIQWRTGYWGWETGIESASFTSDKLLSYYCVCYL